MKTHKNGVTSVEVLVCIAIILLLVAITLPAFKTSTPAGYPSGTRVTRIDGCEYLESGHYNNFTRTHKGNCDNPIHRSNSNLEK